MRDELINLTRPADYVVSAPEGEEVCDFCNDWHPVATIPCEDVVIVLELKGGGRHVQHLVGGWGVCQVCRDLVAARDRAGLLAHARAAAGPDAMVWPAYLERLHEAFWDAHLAAVSGLS